MGLKLKASSATKNAIYAEYDHIKLIIQLNS